VAQRQTHLLRRLVRWAVIGAFVGFIFGTAIAALLFVQLSKTNDFLSEGGRSRAAIFNINDCIDPKGACYKRQQANTAKVIGQIVDSDHDGIPDSKEILDAIKALRR
jgi:hypothetical protein